MQAREDAPMVDFVLDQSSDASPENFWGLLRTRRPGGTISHPAELACPCGVEQIWQLHRLRDCNVCAVLYVKHYSG